MIKILNNPYYKLNTFRILYTVGISSNVLVTIFIDGHATEKDVQNPVPATYRLGGEVVTSWPVPTSLQGAQAVRDVTLLHRVIDSKTPNNEFDKTLLIPYSG